MTDREETGWDPSMRIFRPSRHGEWRPVFERMAEEVRRMTVSRRASAA